MKAAAPAPSLVMIDCDGTLFDSFEANRAFYDEVLRRMGRPPLDAEGRELAHHMATPLLFAHLFRGDTGGLEEATRIARATDYAPYLELMTPVPGMVDTLEWVHDRHDTALATNRGASITRLLARFDLLHHFDLVVGIHDVERPKPAPDMLLHCLRHFGAPASASVYVGDAPCDREASRAAGVRFFAVGGRVPGDVDLPGFADLVAALS